MAGTPPRRWLLAVTRFWVTSFWHKRRLFLGKEWLFTLSTAALVLSVVFIPTSGVGWLLRALSALGVAMGVRRIWRSRNSFDFPERTSSAITRTLAPEVRARLVKVDGEVFLPLDLPSALRNETVATAVAEYTLPGPLKELSHPIILGNPDGSWVVDRPGLGLADIGEATFELRRMTYFQHLSSNNAYRRFALLHGSPEHDVLGSYVSRADGSIVDFGASQLPNLVGISTLAATREGRIFVVQATRRNASGPELIHPSGSGSLEPKDWSIGATAAEVITGAMNRELCEESSVLPEEIVSTELLGMARWLNKGAMPEFFGVTQTSVRADDLSRRKPSGEDPLFVRRVFVTEMLLADVRVELENNVLDLSGMPRLIADSCSGSLGMVLWHIAQANMAAGK